MERKSFRSVIGSEHGRSLTNTKGNTDSLSRVVAFVAQRLSGMPRECGSR